MALKSMAMTAAEAKEMESSCVASSDMEDADLPKFPYGLTLYLNNTVLAKLGMASMPAVGGVMMLSAKVMVTGTSERQTIGGDPEQCLDLQITDMSLTGSAPSMADRAAKLYKDAD